MKLKFIPPPKQVPTFVANVHSTGKIGFTLAGAKHFGITTAKGMQFAINDEDTEDRSLYGVLVSADDANAYKILKGGEYHSVNAKAFFEAISLDYVKKNISFIVTDVEINGTKVLKFTRREPKSNNEPK